MSATSGHNLRSSPSYALARQRVLQRLLTSYGVLTEAALRDLAHCERWEVPFEAVLHRAVDAGRVVRLSDDLYEAGPVET